MYVYDIIEKINRDKIRIGNIDYYPVDKIVNMLYDLSHSCLQWSEDDFAMLAEQKIGDDWEQYYDKTRFSSALEEMINHHDASIGINWDTVDYYLETYCKIKEFLYHK